VITSHPKLLILSLAVLLGSALVTPAFGVKYQKKTATLPQTRPRPLIAVPARAPSTRLATVFSEKGSLVLSVDAVGTDLSFATVEVSKPAGGVLKRAYLAVAATGGYAGPFEDGEVRVEGHGVIWDTTIRNGVGSWNSLSDVTEFVESAISAAPPGPVLIDVSEVHSDLVDGVVLAVVFDAPSAPADNYVALYFGAQAERPDSFAIEFPTPVPSDLADTRYELGVGISYSLQSSDSTDQYTMIDVNGRRLTTSAGGPDDGSPSPGALITVGGFDDSPANPSDPYAKPVNLASDDELYDLRPFLKPGDTRAIVRTSSPSEENLFFASVFSSPSGSREVASVTPAASVAPAAASGATGLRTISLSTASSKASIGGSCEMTATVTQDGVPVPDAVVELKVVAGPHAGAVSRVQTKESGTATFMFRGKRTGRDLVVAILMDGDAPVAGSNSITEDWVEETLETSIDISPGECPNKIDISDQGVVTVGLAGSQTFDVGDVDITSLLLGNAAPLKIQYRDVTQPAGPSECACSDEGGDGTRDIVLQFKLSDVLPDTAAVANGETQKWTLTGSTKSGKTFRLSDCVVISKTPGPPVSVSDDVLTPAQTEVITEQPHGR
jgi:hypothetical protein